MMYIYFNLVLDLNASVLLYLMQDGNEVSMQMFIM
jgi:hypothetical protein